MNMNRILSYIGIEPDNKKDVFLIWLPFAISIFSMFAITFCWFWLYPIENMNDKAIIHQNLFSITLIIISNLLVAINTFIFLVKGSKTAKCEESDTDINTRSFALLTLGHRLINVITLLIAFFILCIFFFRLLYNGYSVEKEDDLKWIVIFVNIFSIIIYVLFCIADKLYIKYLEKCLSIVKDNYKEKYEIQIEVMRKAFFLIDFAGVVGICIIFSMSCFFSSSGVRFIQGFGIGALAFHIFFTQFNWAYLNTNELIKIQNME